MKSFVNLFLVLLSVCSLSHAQHPVFYGTTAGTGGIFRYESKDNTLKNVFRYRNPGIFDKSNMILNKNGRLYGVAMGGPTGYGIIYSLDPETLKFKIEKKFNGVDGIDPSHALVQSSDGILYGTSTRVGKHGRGVLYSFDPVSSVFRILLHFEDVSVYDPGSLTMASDGRLYGFAIGGSNFSQPHSDIFFSFDPVNRDFRFESYLPANFGRRPTGSMVEVNGNLYGLMRIGGNHDYAGTLFSYSLNLKQLKKLYEFNPSTGLSPNGTLTVGSDGKLYSITSGLGINGTYGAIFSFNPNTRSMQVLHVFDGPNGGHGLGGLTEGEDGKLYGMTQKLFRREKYFDVMGSIFFSIDKDGKNYKIVRNFDHPGKSIGGGNLANGSGNPITVGNKIYGVALAEGAVPYEYIFSYESSKDIFQKLISSNRDKGYEPTGSMLQASDGRFYGIAFRGAGFGLGGIFSFNPGTSLYTILLPFNKERGYNPEDVLVQANDQKLYGITSSGGTNDHGVIYSFDPGMSKYSVLKNFKLSRRPTSGFTLGNDGNLYSIIQRQVKTGTQVSYEYLLFSFNPSKGEYKELVKIGTGGFGVFMKASNGILYSSGPTGIYSYDPISKLLNFFPSYQWYSERLIEGADHKLYGMSGDGSVFMFNPVDGSYSYVSSPELYIPQGALIPYGTLVPGTDGLFYGRAHLHSADLTVHALFSFDPLTGASKLLPEFEEFITERHNTGQLVELNKTVPPIVSINDKKLAEGEEAKLTISLNRISVEEIKLNYRTVAGSATDGAKNPDFAPASGEVVIPPGEISTTISVSLLEDDLLETRETFTVILQKANDAQFQIGDSVGVINIKNETTAIAPAGAEIITTVSKLSSGIETVVKNELLIRVSPNPSSDFFMLHIGGNKTDRVSVTVTNLSGQIMNKFDGTLKNSQLVFGQNYRSGSYFVRVEDGKKSKVIKMIKTSK